MHPDFNLVDETFCRCVENKFHKKKLFRSNECCRIIHDVWHASGIIENGGFHRFFDIASKADIKSVVNAYKSVGLDSCAEIILIAEKAYTASKTRLINQNIDADADTIRHSINEELSLLERSFYDMSDLVIEKLAKYIKTMKPRSNQ
jgi:capsule polysaccharide export protein KpsE/RkpR